MAQSRYILDRASSRVTFQGRAFIRSIVGRSDELAGAVSIRGTDVRTMRGEVRFPVISLETEPPMHPREIREVFGGHRYPEVSFLVDSIGDGTEGTKLTLHGRLTMNGVTRPVSFHGRASLVDRRMFASGSADVDLREWDIRAPRRLGGLVGMSSKIRLTFRAEFRARDRSHATIDSP